MRTILFSFTLSLFHLFTATAQPLATNYLIIGPFPIEEGVDHPEDQQKKAVFQQDLLSPETLSEVREGLGFMHLGKSFQWQQAGLDDGYLDLDKFYNKPDYVYAYAYAELDMPEASKRLVGIGSDDAIRIWLNGELVHDNFSLRAHKANEDVIKLSFKKGKNQLLVKVLDDRYDWGFSLQFLQLSDLNSLLYEAARDGQIDEANLLLDNKADPDKRGLYDLTPWQAARMKGRTEMCKMLEKRGATPDLPFPANTEIANMLFNPLGEGKLPGAAVLVAQDGKILFESGFGYADIENNVLVSKETKFRIGSITKQFTAAAIMKLAEQGKLKLHDPLIKYIPDFPKGKDVTIRSLLTHTSGIHSYTGDPRFLERVTKPISPKDLIDEIKKYDYDFEPGTNWAYNNSGYFILGYIVEQVSGTSFDNYLKKTFFTPLGMKNTGVYVNGKKYKNEAKGYSFENDSVALALDWDMSWAGGAGNLYSTVGDLYLWNEAIFNGKVFKPETLKEAHTPAKLNDGSLPSALGNAGYGFGWAIGEFRGAPEISHSGGLHGFITNLSRLPEEKLTVVVLTNSLPQIDKSPTEYTYELFEIFNWPALAEQSSFSVQKDIDPAIFKDYAGQYEYPGGAIMVINVENGQLFAKLATQPAFEIFPQTDAKFFWKAVEAQIEFVRDESGAVTHAMHTQGGQTIKAPRVEAEAAIEIPNEVFDRYAGEYELGGVIISIFREGDRFFTQVTGQPAFEIFAKSETEFFLKVVKATISFESDASGQVTGLVLDQGGVKQRAVKK
jgi:CubicO group peptidase (beta-lactamase class C family)